MYKDNGEWTSVQSRAFDVARRMRAIRVWSAEAGINFVETVRTIESVKFWEGQADKAEAEARENNG